ncbi:uncharacterized protein LOC111381471 [Olea europaea var. sylvestris]|uniref:uncharacterized protein LOC111381471 n=1 Tax=Olea europaea var. sylvestris TaxID=158386 RepID=UPI000C1D43DB|nr:uncharacterized protein LOC111381471 [Olea europaea var. sylvestris]
MIITGDDIDGISVLKTELARQFEMKDLGSLRYFLGIESKYVADILEWARLTDNKIIDTPIEVNAKYSSSDDLPLSDPTLYRTIVGSLVYLTITRPDIAYAVHIVSQFVSSPTSVHWVAVLRILRYLWGTVFQSLLLTSTSSLELRAYSDTDHGSDPTDRKSVTGSKQSIISQSFTEAEYRAMASTTKEIVWLRWLLADMRVFLSHPTPMYCDNQSSIQIAHNSIFHERTKHIEIDCHLTRHHLKHDTIILLFVSFSLQFADFFYQVAFYFSFSFSSWQTLDACSCRIGDRAEWREEVNSSQSKERKPDN